MLRRVNLVSLFVKKQILKTKKLVINIIKTIIIYKIGVSKTKKRKMRDFALWRAE